MNVKFRRIYDAIVLLMQSEKNARASLKAAIERGIDNETILIADDLNYIKGFRYELFCIARAQGEFNMLISWR